MGVFAITFEKSGLADLSDKVALLEKLGKDVKKYLAILADPSSSMADKMAAYQFFAAVYNQQGPYAVLNSAEMGDLRDQIKSALKQVMGSEEIKIPSPGGGTCTVYNKATGQPATLYDFITNPNGEYTFSFEVKHRPDNVNWSGKNVDDYNDTSNVPYFGWGEDVGSFNVPTDANGNPIPGGGINVDQSYEGKCSGNEKFACSGTGLALEGYCTIQATTSNPTAPFDNILKNMGW